MSRLGRGYPNNALMRQTPPIGFVVYDSTGAGNSGSVASAGTLTWSHAIGASANGLTVLAAADVNTSSINVTCKIGTTAVPLLGQNLNFYINSPENHTLLAFGILKPPTGTQTITLTNSSGTSGTFTACSTAYTGVAAFGTALTQTGTGASLSHTVTSGRGQMLVQAASEGNATTASGSFSSYSQTSRSNIAGGSVWPFVMGDAPGAASVSFTATVPGSAQTWGSLIVPLIPV